MPEPMEKAPSLSSYPSQEVTELAVSRRVQTQSYSLQALTSVTPELPGDELLKRKILQSVDAAPMFGFPVTEKFLGSGVYLLYYHGDSTLLQGCVSEHHPIYVGASWSDNNMGGKRTLENRLFKRLTDHQKSFEYSTGMSPQDFRWKAVILGEMHILDAERLLINLLDPVLNTLGGFGTTTGRDWTKYDAIWDRPGNTRGKPRNISGRLAELQEEAMIKLNMAIDAQARRTIALDEQGGSLLKLYLADRASARTARPARGRLHKERSKDQRN